MKRNTKSALLLSVVSIILCCTMLLGTTMAWFTDSVTSARNTIIAGNLDIEVEYTLDGENWADLEGATDMFKDMLWEPGYTRVVALKVTNAGNLALKYNANMNILSETPGVNVLGDEFNLSDYIEVSTLVQQADNIGDITLSLAFSGENSVMYEATNNFTAAEIISSDKELLPDAAHYVIIKVDMSTTVGNEANHNGETVPQIDFGVSVVATQFTYEEDSFDKQYDADAEYPIVPEPVEIDSTISFTDFESLIENGGNIYLTESVTVANPENSRFTEFELKGNVGIYAAEGAKLTFAETTSLLGNGTLTVYGGCIDEKQELCVAGNATLAFESGEHSFAALSASENGKIVVNGGTLNCLGTYGGILGICFSENGQLIVNDGTLNMYQPFNLNPNRCDAAYIEINGGTIDLLNGIENLFVVRNVMDKDMEDGGVLRGSSIRVNGGTFIAHYEIDSAGDATSFVRNSDSPADTNKVLVSNVADKYDCVVTGGTFYGSWQRADNQRYTNGNGGYSDGLFVENSIAGFVADGYEITGDATNGYVVSAK